jgi:hypothetical protein
MNRVTYFLFAIPAISIVVIALYQIIDEMTKKHFVLERRTGMSADDSPKRRYVDAVPTEPLRNSETATFDPTSGTVSATGHEA